MRVSVGLPVRPGLTLGQLASCAGAAEASGFFAVNLTDHPAPPDSWLHGGGHHTLDPFVGLAIAAGATNTLRLHTNIIVLGYRHARLLAKSASSLDSLSGGRLVLGVGVGYLREEFEALGANFDGRGAAADNALSMLRTELGPDVPIWVGGNSKAAMRRTVTAADGWAPMPSPQAAAKRLGTPGLDDVDELARRIAILHEMADGAGRPHALDVIVLAKCLSGFATSKWDADQAIEEISALQAAGGTALAIELGTSDPAEWRAEAERFASDVLPKI
jgi:alkanesulfonate monooxygenase SsuD/methylene tetrahydromethanopterin reductase-like flavin-dependent oxidoreductase (luciferase family)